MTAVMSRQQVYNKVVRHLLKQGRRAATPTGVCMYRTGEGLRCAVGYLISDDKYHPDMEGGLDGAEIQRVLADVGAAPYATATTAAATAAVTAATTAANGIWKDGELLSALQIIHDYGEPAAWRGLLRRFARNNGLTWPRCRPSEGYIK